MKDVLKKAQEYWMSAGRNGLAHYRAAEIAAKRNRQIGIPNVALSSIVATSVFATLSENVDVRIKFATGAIALITAILAALQAFLSFGDRAERHKAAGAKYGSIRRKIDMFILEFSEKQHEKEIESAISKLIDIADELNSLANESPTLTEKVYNIAKKAFDGSQKDP
jgi:hypothetical protein